MEKSAAGPGPRGWQGAPEALVYLPGRVKDVSITVPLPRVWWSRMWASPPGDQQLFRRSQSVGMLGPWQGQVQNPRFWSQKKLM